MLEFWHCKEINGTVEVVVEIVVDVLVVKEVVVVDVGPVVVVKDVVDVDVVATIVEVVAPPQLRVKLYVPDCVYLAMI